MFILPDTIQHDTLRIAVPSGRRVRKLAAFAQALRRLREAYGQSIDLPDLTVAEFATMLHVSHGIYLQYENGTRAPDLAFLVALHRRTGLTLSAFTTADCAPG